jgi:hypothetical protein
MVHKEMIMTDNSLKSEIEYLRDLALAGDEAPLLGGRFLTWWGGVITLAYCSHYAILKGVAGLGPSALSVMWPIVMGVAFAGYVLLIRSMPSKPGAGSPGNRAEQVIWMAGGLAIFSFFVGLLLSQVAFGSGIHPDASLPVVFAVYGLSLLTTGSLARQGVMVTAGWVAIAMVGVCAALFNRDELYLAGAFGAFASVFVPGLLLLRAEPRSVV